MPDPQEELLALVESAPDLVFTQDLLGRIARVNRAFERVTGYCRTQAVGTIFTDYLIPEDRARVNDILIGQAGGALPPVEDYTFITAKGEHVRLQIGWQLAFENGTPCGWRAFARDVRERDRQKSAKALAETRLIETSNELAKFTRHLQLLHRLSNTNYTQLEALANSYLAAGCEIFETGYGALTQITGQSYTFAEPPESLALRATDRLELQSRLVARILAERSTIILTGPLAADTPFSYFIGAPILLDDMAHGTITFWTTRDRSAGAPHPQAREIVELMAKRIGLWMEQRRLTDELAHQAHHDALTGLPNRVFLRNRLQEALEHAEKTKGNVAVVFIDLDRFKQINDTLGHTIGDGLLQQVAGRLKTCMTGNDILARMGGDEFTAILTGFQELEDAVHTARRLLTAVRKASNVEGFELFVSASIGLAFYPRDGSDSATLLRNADTAMYTAKYRGKNQVHCYSDEGVDSAFERLELEHSLRRSLEKSELRILYQPQVEVAAAGEDLRLSGLEVLLVWDHPKLGRISPSQFIPIAEESGMILQIGSWVMREACLQAVQWQRSGHSPFRISVNVSALQFGQENFVVMVASILEESGLDPNWLELELTESLVMQDIDQSVSRMAELRNLGVRIAIDDFGTGYSSLSYLRRLPADTLKIDRSFLEEGGYGPGALALIQTIVVLAHNMGLSVTAEGVETLSHLELVQKAGCDNAQGHLFGAALDVPTVEKLFSRRCNGLGTLVHSAEAKEPK